MCTDNFRHKYIKIGTLHIEALFLNTKPNK